jgi:hypothetical protein
MPVSVTTKASAPNVTERCPLHMGVKAQSGAVGDRRLRLRGPSWLGPFEPDVAVADFRGQSIERGACFVGAGRLFEACSCVGKQGREVRLPLEHGPFEIGVQLSHGVSSLIEVLEPSLAVERRNRGGCHCSQ